MIQEFIDEVASSDDESSEDERSGSEDEREVNTRRGQLGRLRKNKNPEDYAKYFQCFEKHDGTENDENPNKRTIEVVSLPSRSHDGMWVYADHIHFTAL